MARDSSKLMLGIYICVLILYLQCMLLEGNREIHLCDKDSTNISCDNDSVVFIEDVKFRPLPYNTVMMKDNNSLDEELKLTIQGICNDTYHCYLNNSFGDLTYSIPQLPRLLNVTYRCDYAYVGCFVDHENRLLKGTKIMEERSMSASICNRLCNNERQHLYQYFGTENSEECFCGNGNNLGKGIYIQKRDADCNASCANNKAEKCGRHGLISIYTTKTAIQEMRYVNISEIQSKTCDYSSQIKDVQLVSIQKTAECDSSIIENYHDQLDEVCEEETYCFNKPIPIEPSEWQDLQFRTKYLMVNFSCRVSEIVINMRVDEDKSGFTGIVIGVICGLSLACVAVVIICIVLQRRRRTKEIDKNNGTHTVKADCSHTRRNESADTDHHLSVEYANVQGQDNVYFNTRFETKSSYNSKSKYCENKHNISSVNVPSKTSEEQISRGSITSDHYVVHPEGVYDVSNMPQYRNKDDTDQAIYSHAVDDIYDTSNTPHILQQEETYDHYHGQTSDNDYSLSK